VTPSQPRTCKRASTFLVSLGERKIPLKAF
jgi:hypothetical protein